MCSQCHETDSSPNPIPYSQYHSFGQSHPLCLRSRLCQLCRGPVAGVGISVLCPTLCRIQYHTATSATIHKRTQCRECQVISPAKFTLATDREVLPEAAINSSEEFFLCQLSQTPPHIYSLGTRTLGIRGRLTWGRLTESPIFKIKANRFYPHHF
jgi:hypothetical protein